MRLILPWILTLFILIGQLIKIPVGTSGGLTLLDIAVAFFCLLGLFQIKLNLKKPPLFIMAAIIFIIVACFSLILTPLHLSILEYLTSFFYTIRFCLYILLGWLIFSGALTYLKENLSEVLQFSGIGLASLGLLQFIFLPDLQFLTPGGWDPHFFRTVSTFLDPNFAGVFFVLTLLLLVNNYKSNLNYIFFFLVYIALLTTFSRSSYGMFLISLSALSLLKKSWKLQIFSIILFAILWLGFYIYTLAVSQPRNIDRMQSATSRINTWQQGFEMFKQNPILGVGFNAYRYAIRQYKLSDEEFLKSHGSSSNDSSLLFVLSTTGIIGLISYLYFLYALAITNRNFAVPGICGLLFASNFANSLFFPPILLWILITAVPKK